MCEEGSHSHDAYKFQLLKEKKKNWTLIPRIKFMQLFVHTPTTHSRRICARIGLQAATSDADSLWGTRVPKRAQVNCIHFLLDASNLLRSPLVFVHATAKD